MAPTRTIVASAMAALTLCAGPTLGQTDQDKTHQSNFTKEQPNFKPIQRTGAIPRLGGVRVTVPRVRPGFRAPNTPPPMFAPTPVRERTLTTPPPVLVYQPVLVSPYADGSSYYAPGDVIATTGTGLTVDGQYSNDRLSLGLHLGNADIARYVYGSYRTPYRTYRYRSYGCDSDLRYYSSDRDYRYPYDSYVRTTPMDGQLLQLGSPVVTSGTSQPVIETAEPKDLTVLEQADLYLRQGQTSKAIAAYREHMLNNGDDVVAMRRLALALLANGSVDESAAMMGLAYQTDAAALAPQPIDADLIPGGRTNYRKLLGKAVRHAHQMKTGSSWLLVAVLMQGEDRVDVALKMIERAKAAGLDEQIIREMTDALSL